MNLAANFSAEVAADLFFLITLILFIELADLWDRQFAVMPPVSLFTLLLFLAAAPLYRASVSVCWDTPYSGVLLEKLTVPHLVKKFSTLYGAL